ncbi:bifunctional phosphopantothenoylcysteine decarboxylase/phosphopantothenate--cysteine ligase CoaBC [Asticcacaulis sp. ZE23SCel15]|uniref:bifunctional phosphopantothenoylcysteine decarboxylase/phosphopantothenate--cysteine ligase CoaBC n=1 Tax=Asticcacaulis sp. ZE23SCel15 TaxID=3059027 RepID=UPI00265E0C8B|nr:bifunctional phosphopantothenoylcysteine decarboxylase/phosphopantothenate--cysteine ligase CoaBC [Asticcacaulis sp. ZE23SCel15]WKL58491.1 bifunctional phosphopantothenoylcysteine decarboxylase/phosphopantothenate--cysteine ligase CoaBC [Asticcacaulis sp. ZE23SCel15]
MAAPAQKRVLLIIGGGIAAYKSLSLIRLLRTAGIGVRVVLTDAAKEFVTPLSAGALSNDKVYTDLFDLNDEAEMGHIALSRSADLVVVAPATANMMAKLANGLADDLASTLLLATDKRVMMAPAMNVRMWHHGATQRNVATLNRDGVLMVGPEEGDMACGEFGLGRMAEPETIFKAIMAQLNPRTGALNGKHVLMTAGPTFEPLDPVRGITNRSSGKQGFAIAEALAAEGANVTLISGPVSLPTPEGVERIDVRTALEMFDAVHAHLPADAFIGVAAVSDWRAQTVAADKQKKSANSDELTITLIKNPDILASVGLHTTLRPTLVIGFAAETQNLEVYGKTKLRTKGADAIFANEVGDDKVFDQDTTNMMLIDAQGPTAVKRLTKAEVATDITHYVINRLT